jgi:thiosulfate/3-mercaptopyruvate sulfurtransferase
MTLSLPALVDVGTLAASLEHPNLRVFDATVRLIRSDGGGPYRIESGRGGYEQGHIPGAAFADIPGALSDPGSPYPFTIPSASRFAAAAGRLGIGTGVHVVAYAQESPMWATRLWWLLRYFGFDSLSVLDGGLRAWVASGGELHSGASGYRPTDFRAVARPELLATRDEVKKIVEAGGSCLINALQPAVFRGEGASSYARPGRIPRSTNVPWTGLVDAESGLFVGDLGMRELLGAAGALGDEPVVAYCGGGISATVALFGHAVLEAGTVSC